MRFFNKKKHKYRKSHLNEHIAKPNMCICSSIWSKVSPIRKTLIKENLGNESYISSTDGVIDNELKLSTILYIDFLSSYWLDLCFKSSLQWVWVFLIFFFVPVVSSKGVCQKQINKIPSKMPSFSLASQRKQGQASPYEGNPRGCVVRSWWLKKYMFYLCSFL